MERPGVADDLLGRLLEDGLLERSAVAGLIEALVTPVTVPKL